MSWYYKSFQTGVQPTDDSLVGMIVGYERFISLAQLGALSVAYKLIHPRPLDQLANHADGYQLAPKPPERDNQ